MASLFKNLFSSSKLIKKLFDYKQNEDDQDQWTMMAIELLVKLLKKEEKGSIQKLEKVLNNPQENCDKCLILNCYNEDGEFDISGNKFFAHVAACRIWRWPDVRNHDDVQSLTDICKFPFSYKNTKFCINPYHYRRVVILPVLVEINQAQSVNSLSSQNYQRHDIKTASYITISIATDDDLEYRTSSDSDFRSLSDANLTSGTSYDSVSHSSCFFSSDTRSMDTDNNPEIIQISLEKQLYWADIAYYELNSRVGGSFPCRKQSIIVDGSIDTTDSLSKFCLGQLKNLNRPPSVENSRKHIGKGLHLYMIGAEIFVQCLTTSSIFVQSSSASHAEGLHSNTVYKVPCDYTFTLFNFEHFSALLSQRVAEGPDAVYDLTKMCTIR